MASTKFEPGQSGNPAGRPKGARNKATVLSEKITDFLEGDFELFLKDWKEIKALERTKLRAQLYEYVVPKLSRGRMEFDLSALSDEEVSRLLEIAVTKIATNDDAE